MYGSNIAPVDTARNIWSCSPSPVSPLFERPPFFYMETAHPIW